MRSGLARGFFTATVLRPAPRRLVIRFALSDRSKDLREHLTVIGAEVVLAGLDREHAGARGLEKLDEVFEFPGPPRESIRVPGNYDVHVVALEPGRDPHRLAASRRISFSFSSSAISRWLASAW